jgi:hypothetical protein
VDQSHSQLPLYDAARPRTGPIVARGMGPYRLRIIHIVPDWNVRIALMRGDSAVRWRPLAKDGAELPAHLQTIAPPRSSQARA